MSERRLNKRFRVTYAVLDRESPDGSKRYKVVPKNEAKAPGTSLMHQEMMYPRAIGMVKQSTIQTASQDVFQRNRYRTRAPTGMAAQHLTNKYYRAPAAYLLARERAFGDGFLDLHQVVDRVTEAIADRLRSAGDLRKPVLVLADDDHTPRQFEWMGVLAEAVSLLDDARRLKGSNRCHDDALEAQGGITRPPLLFLYFAASCDSSSNFLSAACA